MANTNLLHVSELAVIEVLKMTRPGFWVYAFLGQNLSFLTLGLDSAYLDRVLGLDQGKSQESQKMSGWVYFRP